MKYLLRLTVLLTCSAVLITSCKSKTSKLGKLIPKEATMIVDLNLKSISEQVSWDDIKKTTWYMKAQSDTNTPPVFKIIMDHPENNGIDGSNDLLIFMLKNGASQQFVVEGTVKDAKAFESLNKNMIKGARDLNKSVNWDQDTTVVLDTTISKDGEINMLMLGEKGMVGWNQERFVYVFEGPDMGKGFFPMPDQGTMTKTESMVPSIDKLKETCRNIFNLKEENSLFKNEKIAQLFAEDGEIHYWLNTEQMLKGSMQFGMLNMLKLDKFIDGNMSGATINFDNGKIAAHYKMYFGQELSDILKKSSGDLNAEMVKMLSGNNIAGMYAMHFRPETMQELLTLTGMDGFLNMFLAQQGVTISDFIKATKGDMVIGVTDLKMKVDTSTSMDHAYDSGRIHYSNTPDVSVIFAMAINDKDAFHKLFKAFEKMNNESGSSKLSYKETDKYFVMGNNQAAVDKYISAKQTEHPFLDKIKSNQFGGFVDIQTILKAFQSEFRDSSDKVIYALNTGMWENAYLYGGEWEDGGISSRMDVNLVDKTTNSLKQLNKYFDDLSRVMIAKEEARTKEWKDHPIMDSVPPKPVIVTKKVSKKRK